MKKYIFILFLIIGFSAKPQEKNLANSEYNKKYKKSITSKHGRLSTDELSEMKSSLAKELQISLENNKALVIYYFQHGKNCLLASYNYEGVLNILNNKYRIANSAEKRFNIKSYYVYNSNSFFNTLLAKQEAFILDSGFFKNVLFKEDRNCEGFYILKENGDYMRYYGSDYSDEIENFIIN